MALKLTKVKGSPFWYVRGTVCGRNIYESTGLREERLADAYRIRKEGLIQDNHAFGRKDSVTFAQAAAMYLKSGRKDKFLSPVLEALAHEPVENLKQPHIDALALKLYPKQSNATRDRMVYTPFVAVMNYAAENEFCPYRKWRRPKKQEQVRKTRFATVEQVGAMYKAASSHIKPLIVLLAYTGLRMGEALNLDWQDVDLSKRWLIVRKSKTGRPRGVPLHKAVIRELTPLMKRQGPVIQKYSKNKTAYKKPKHGGSVAKRARNAAATKAGIGHITWHDFRHTCATWLMMANISREMRQDMLGHARGAVHDTYIHVPSNALIEAIDKLPDFAEVSRET